MKNQKLPSDVGTIKKQILKNPYWKQPALTESKVGVFSRGSSSPIGVFLHTNLAAPPGDMTARTSRVSWMMPFPRRTPAGNVRDAQENKTSGNQHDRIVADERAKFLLKW